MQKAKSTINISCDQCKKQNRSSILAVTSAKSRCRIYLTYLTYLAYLPSLTYLSSLTYLPYLPYLSYLTYFTYFTYLPYLTPRDKEI